MSQPVLPNYKPVSVGILLKEKQVLLGQRPEKSKEGADLWEFPGGSIEPGEQAHQALVRELKEELNIQVKKTKICACLCDYQKKVSRLIIFFYVFKWEGDIQKNYHQQLKWHSLKDCTQKKLPNINPSLFKNILSLIGEGMALF